MVSARCGVAGTEESRSRIAFSGTSTASARPDRDGDVDRVARIPSAGSATRCSWPDSESSQPSASRRTTTSPRPRSWRTGSPASWLRTGPRPRPAGHSTFSTMVLAGSRISDLARTIVARSFIPSRRASPIVVIAETSGEQPTQPGDLSRPVGAHLCDEDVGPRSEPVVDRTGQPQHVVEARRAREHRPAPRHQVRGVVLRRGLAVRARDRHHPRRDLLDPRGGRDFVAPAEMVLQRVRGEQSDLGDRQRPAAAPARPPRRRPGRSR